MLSLFRYLEIGDTEYETKLSIIYYEKINMRPNYFFSITLKISVCMYILCSVFRVANAQQVTSEKLYTSSVFTPAHGFTSGIEGPAVDKVGTIYAVNFEKRGTIGQVTPLGKASLFIELPSGSDGSGIRFDSKGNMLIADYTNHNILKVDMSSKKISVLVHEPEMSQPNDIAIDKRDCLYASVMSSLNCRV